jgi:hypothetical protein
MSDDERELLQQINDGAPGERKGVNSVVLLSLHEAGLISVSLTDAGRKALARAVREGVET